jgi:YVTN family beta-propeller protein
LSSTPSADRQPTRWTRRRLGLAILVLFVAGLVAAALDLRFAIGGSPRRVEPNSLLVLDPRTADTRHDVGLGRRPGAVAAGAGAVWVVVGSSVTRVDPRTGGRVATTRLPAAPADVAAGAGVLYAGALIPPRPSVFADDCTGTEHAAAGEGAVWLACPDRAALTRVDGRTGRASDVALPDQPSSVAVGEGYVWVTLPRRNLLLAVDPATRRVVRRVTVGTEPVGVAAGFGAAWVANAGNGSITRVDAHGSKVEAIGLSEVPSAIAAGAGAVWVASTPNRTVVRVDPKDNAITERVRLANPPLDVAAGAGAAWVTIGD